jgi:hypothetical protein
MPVAVQVREIIRYAGDDVHQIGAVLGHNGLMINRRATGGGRMIGSAP